MTTTTFRQLQQCFVDTLVQIYEQSEIKAIFFRLIEDLYNLQRYQILLDFDKQISLSVEKEIIEGLNRLATAEPLQYITCKAYFYGREFYVEPGVLIPRSETEELINHCISVMTQKCRVLDIGTGSGCIATTLAVEKKESEIVAIDISPKAISVAKRNALSQGVDVAFFDYDIFSLPSPIYKSKFDLIVSNPPYVTDAEMDVMHKNVVEYEPHLALFVPNEDALRYYRIIAIESTRLLKKYGWVIVEINEAFGEETAAVFRHYFCKVTLINDLHGKPRFVKAHELKIV